MSHQLTKEFLQEIRARISSDDALWLKEEVLQLHYADIAEIIDELSNEEAKYVYYLVDDEDLQADILMELDEEVRDRFISSLSTKEIADQLENLDSDDAADILADLSKEQIHEVISQMEDDDAAEDIVDLLNYAEDTAGGLMQKEFFQAHVVWTVRRALIELRKQAEDVEKVYNIFVVNEFDQLVGVLSLKRLLFADTKTTIEELYQSKNIIKVKTSDSAEEVARIMEKYDLVSIPVVDYQNKLVGRITLDDVVDFIREEADKDFQMATGISEASNGSATLWRAGFSRLPWLIIAMVGGIIGAKVIAGFEGGIAKIPALAFFIPLITAMGGNVGVQSSAIVVQAIAKGDIGLKRVFPRLAREAGIGLMNGLILSGLIFGIAFLFSSVALATVVSLSLLTVIVFAATFGTLFPMLLHRYRIDPALAIGPFVTTLNDIIGLFIYFSIGMLLFNI
ncbi:MAG: magnesium transporter [Flavobacteriales bacterium]